MHTHNGTHTSTWVPISVPVPMACTRTHTGTRTRTRVPISVPVLMAPYPYPYSHPILGSDPYSWTGTRTRTHGLGPVPVLMTWDPYPYSWPGTRTHTRTHDGSQYYKSGWFSKLSSWVAFILVARGSHLLRLRWGPQTVSSLSPDSNNISLELAYMYKNAT